MSLDDPLLGPLGALGAKLAPHLERCIELTVAPGVGRSRLGGTPWLPDDLEWPTQRFPKNEVRAWPDYARDEIEDAVLDGTVTIDTHDYVMPLRYLGMLDFASLAPFDLRLPNDGSLELFVSIATPLASPDLPFRVAAAAIHVPSSMSKRPRAHPLQPEPLLRGEVHLAARWGLDMAYGVLSLTELGLSTKERLRGTKLISTERPSHVLFPMARAETPSIPPRDELALVQIVEVPDIGLFIGDASWLTFVIPEPDLAARRFDRVRASIFVG